MPLLCQRNPNMRILNSMRLLTTPLIVGMKYVIKGIRCFETYQYQFRLSHTSRVTPLLCQRDPNMRTLKSIIMLITGTKHVEGIHCFDIC